MHCFTWRTKSPPVSSSVSRIAARSSPRVHSKTCAREPRVGRAGLREPGVVLGRDERTPESIDVTRACGDRLRWPPRRGRRRDAVGATALVREARHERGELGRREVVEQPLADRLREEQVGLGVQPGQHLARRCELPAREVPPRLEHAEHAVELPGEALGAALHPALEPRQVTFEALDRDGGADSGVALGILRDRMLRHRGLQGLEVVVTGVAPSRALPLDAAQRIDGLALERTRPWRVRHGEIDVADRRGRRREVTDTEADELARRRETEQADAAAARALG